MVSFSFLDYYQILYDSAVKRFQVSPSSRFFIFLTDCKTGISRAEEDLLEKDEVNIKGRIKPEMHSLYDG